MTDNEANKVIAEYMGFTVYPQTTEIMPQSMSCIRIQHLNYTSSLDALIPVWERLKEDGVWINKMGNRNYNHFGFFSEKQSKDYSPFDPFDFYEKLHTDTIQEAAAHATAKAILALGEE